MKILFFILTFLLSCTHQAKKEVNYDESQVPDYNLPTILENQRGDLKTYWKGRRTEILDVFKKEMFGVVPEESLRIDSKLIESGEFKRGILREQYKVGLSNKRGRIEINLITYRPKAKKQIPFFLGFNFRGNHTIADDSKIFIHVDKTDQLPGSRKGFWEIENTVSKGIGLATAYYGDIDPDFDDGFKNGIHKLFPELQKRKDNFSSIAGWAYGLIHLNTFLRGLDFVDASKVVAMGHSRLGKTSLYASALDERFFGTISNNSGCGGSSLSKREFGETLYEINTRFPHWFATNFHKYNHKEKNLKFDQHMLMALIAPRPLYITSASKDPWADPKGEFLSLLHASEVYEKVFGLDGISKDKWPKPNGYIHKDVAYHYRDGKHKVTKYDWDKFIEFFF